MRWKSMLRSQANSPSVKPTPIPLPLLLPPLPPPPPPLSLSLSLSLSPLARVPSHGRVGSALAEGINV